MFEDQNEAVRYCDLLQGGGQDCEGVAEIEASSVSGSVACQTDSTFCVFNINQNFIAGFRSLPEEQSSRGVVP